MTNVLFVHQNFPAQFRNVAQQMAARPGYSVVAIGSFSARELPGMRLIKYGFSTAGLQKVHPFARHFEMDCRRAEQIVYVASELASSGFVPDLIFVHCGWGEGIPLRALFKRAKIVTYVEYYYRDTGTDADFDPEWPNLTQDGVVGLHMRNAATLLALAETDIAISPTQWQRSTFPARYQPFIDVCHEGIDLDVVRPDPTASLTLEGRRTVSSCDEVVTYVARSLEPLRGYHVFMRALPKVLQARPQAQVLIVGADHVSYGASAPGGKTWKDVFLDEVRSDIDLSRVTFLGQVSYAEYLKVLQVSSAHVYLTYPFVLSWSLLEAMAAECLVVASSTSPVLEVVNETNGLLVDFLDSRSIANAIIGALRDKEKFAATRRRARETVKSRFAIGDCLTRLEKILRR